MKCTAWLEQRAAALQGTKAWAATVSVVHITVCSRCMALHMVLLHASAAECNMAAGDCD